MQMYRLLALHLSSEPLVVVPGTVLPGDIFPPEKNKDRHGNREKESERAKDLLASN